MAALPSATVFAAGFGSRDAAFDRAARRVRCRFIGGRTRSATTTPASNRLSDASVEEQLVSDTVRDSQGAGRHFQPMRVVRQASAGEGALGRREGLAAVAAAAAFAACAPPPSDASAASRLDAVVELTPDNFASEVEAPGAGRVFVEFYAPWCPFCQRLEPTWNELPSKLKDAGVATKIARMNVDTYVDYGQAYGVTGFPTLMLFQDGRPVGQKTGLIDMATALKYAGVKDQGVLASLSGPAPQMNLVLSGPQVDQALENLGELRKEVEALPAGERAAAVERIKSVEALFAKRSL